MPLIRYLTPHLKIALCSLTLMFTASLAAADDLIIDNVRGYTHSQGSAKTTPTRFSSLFIRDGRVLTTDPDQIAKLANGKTQRINGQGRVLLPGLIDAHGHLAGLAQLLASVDLRDASSAQAAANKVAQFAAQSTNALWIGGRGWNQENWDGKQFPTAAHLDALNIDKPIVLERVDGHAVWVNSKALSIAGIDNTTVDPAGGQIVRDATGRATGVLIDNAITYVTRKLPSTSAAERERTLNLAFNHLLSLGVTGVHDAGIGQPMIDLLTQRAAQGGLPIRVYGMLDGSDKSLLNWLKTGPIADANDTLSIRSVKLYADGALGSRGAALLADYADDPGNRGLHLTSQQALMDLFTAIDKHQFQICVHAIGDQANRQVLDNFEVLFKRGGNAALRHRIEHAQVIEPTDLKRLSNLNLIASMQPTHATSDMHMAEDRLGQSRLTGAYAWQTLLKGGTRMAFGSDFPVESANPFFGIHAAVTRQDHNNLPVKGWRADQAVSVGEALRIFTRDNAWAAHMENQVGTLEPGKWADFILLEQDPYTLPAHQLWQITVDETWVAGEQRWRAPK